MPTTEIWRPATAWSVEFQLIWVLVALACTTLPRDRLMPPLACKMVPACDAALLTTMATDALVTPALKSPAVIHTLALEAKTLISPVMPSRSNAKSPLSEKVPAKVACRLVTLTAGVPCTPSAGKV